MKTKILTLFLLISISASASDGDYDSYFNGNDSLPTLFYCDSLSVGVSDAAMDSAEARRMAITRALFLYAVSQKVGVKMMSDMYSSSSHLTNTYYSISEKCITLANVTLSPVTLRYTIIDESISDRGETFVFLKIGEKGDSCATISADCDFMSSYRKDSHENCEYKTLMSVSSQNENACDTMFYSVKGILERPIVSSQYGDYEKFFARKVLLYNDEGYVPENTGKQMYTMKNGTWCAIVQSLCYSIVNIIYEQSYVKKISESYEENMKDLSREVVVSDFACSPQFSGIKNNKACIAWSIQEL